MQILTMSVSHECCLQFFHDALSLYIMTNTLLLTNKLLCTEYSIVVSSMEYVLHGYLQSLDWTGGLD